MDPLAFVERRVENHATAAPGALPFQSNCPEGGAVVSGASGQVWNYKKPESELHSAPGSMPCMPIATQRLSAPPPPQLQAPPFLRPVYHPPNSSWDPWCLNHQFPLNPISPCVVPNTFHCNVRASLTPLAQMQGPSMQHFKPDVLTSCCPAFFVINAT
ncbi:hypothetical protein REPUB_Repub19eG0055800 [Reevesia pubescens]